jgi:hypothetical protein
MQGNEGRSVDQMLDWGAEGGMSFFTKFLPLYLQIYSGPFTSIGDLEARYDEQRGMNLARLATVRDTLSKALEEAQTQQYTQQNCAIRLPAVWSGGAASVTAHRMMVEQVRLAGKDIQAARAAVSALTAFIDAARSAVLGKAVTVRNVADFDGDNPRLEIDGRSPDDVQEMIDIRNATQWISNSQARDVSRWFPARNLDTGSNEADSGRNPVDKEGSLGHTTRVVVNYWLDNVFKPAVEGKLTIFATVCDQADGDINRAYRYVTDALNAVHDTRYPRPADARPTQPGPSPSGPGPAPSAPRSSPLPTPVPSPAIAAASVEETMPSGVIDPGSLVRTAQSVASVASGLASTVSQPLAQGLSALSAQIQQGIDGLLSGHTASAGTSPGTTGQPVAEFDIAGKRVKVEQAENGGLELVLSDSNGPGKSYTLELDEHGVPVITTDDRGAPSGSSSPDYTPDEQKPPANSGDASGSAAARPESHTIVPPASRSIAPPAPGNAVPSAPQPKQGADGRDVTVTTPKQPAHQSGSGAELAEAGPL